jgi:tetratricopeptide (TPR) repeat protein
MRFLQVFSFCIFIFTSISVSANRGLQNIVKQIDTAQSVHTFQKAAEELNLLNQQDWLTYYWSSYCYAMMAYKSPKSQKDALLDQAETLLEKSMSLKKDEAELLLLKGWILSTRMVVAPLSRAEKLMPEAEKLLEKANLLDPDNPRYYFLKACIYYYSPPAMGGGKDKAQPLFAQALDKYKTHQPKGENYPVWGENHAALLLSKINSK